MDNSNVQYIQLDGGRAELALDGDRFTLLVHLEQSGLVYAVPLLTPAGDLLVALRWDWSRDDGPDTRVAKAALEWAAGIVTPGATTWLLIRYEDEDMVSGEAWLSVDGEKVTYQTYAHRRLGEVNVKADAAVPQAVRDWLTERVETPLDERPGRYQVDVSSVGDGEGESPIERTRRQHAARLGENVDRVRTVRLDLDALLSLGTLVDVDVRGLTLFTAQSTWEDLGITESDVRRKRFSRPMIYLLPKPVRQKFNTLGARARNDLSRYSFDVMGFRPWRWVPFTAYRKWRGRHRELTEKWDDARQELILDAHDDLLEALRQDLRQAAAETYVTLVTGVHSTGDLLDQETFTRRFVERLIARFPTREAIQANLRLEYSTAALINPTMVEAELAARDRVRRAREVEWEVQRREQRLAWEQVDAERAELQARQSAATHQLRMLELDEQHRQTQLTEMRQAEMEHYRQQLQEMASPMAAVFNQLRAQVYDDAQAVAASLRKHGTLIGASARRARNMCQTFRMLDALDDQELSLLVTQIEGQLNEPAPERNMGEITAVMGDIVDLTHQASVELETMQRGRGRWAAVQALDD